MMDELLEQFLIEGRDLVQQASDDLLALERDPLNASRIDSAFRAVHTLKGSAALFDSIPKRSQIGCGSSTGISRYRRRRAHEQRPRIFRGHRA